jgi:hypothetical protein
LISFNFNYDWMMIRHVKRVVMENTSWIHLTNIVIREQCLSDILNLTGANLLKTYIDRWR